jgi:SAM-dependent methyltransferase
MKSDFRQRLAQKAARPNEIFPALVRRLSPTSKRFGYNWVHLPDGSVTFREHGFVSADSPASLLARHNFETLRIRLELEGSTALRSLEIGCGFGRLSPTFSEYSQHHVAIDINAEALRLAHATYPDIMFLQASAGSLPFADGYFDVVSTWTVIQHVRPEAIASVCAELRRVLAPDGTLLLCEETRWPDKSGGHSWHRRPSEYAALLSPLSLQRHSYISEIDRLQGMESPGEVMVFQR